MEKRLLAVAVAGALGALAAPAIGLAQSTVQIYGRATFEYGRMDQGPGRKDTDNADTPGGSELGIKGVEQLGGGMSAWFQCASSMDITGHDTASLCTRNSAVGFRGGFGNVFAGKWDTPFKRVMGIGTVGAEETGILGMSFLPFGGSGGADASGTGVDGSLRARWKRREANLMTYETPSFGGFQVMAAATAGNRAAELPGTSNDPNPKSRVWSVGGSYVNGPIGIGLGYERHVDFGAFQPGATEGLDDSAWGLSAAYTFGPVKIGAAYMKAEYDTGGGTELKKDSWLIGADWAIAGPHSVSIQYAAIGDSKGNSPVGIGGTSNGAHVASGNDTGGDAWSLAYQYAFSKRTTVKLGYVRVDNDSNTNTYRVGNSAALNANGVNRFGENTDGWAFLVKHNF